MIGLIIIVLFAFIGPLMNNRDYAAQNVEHRNLPAKIAVLDKVPFLPFDGKGQMVEMHIRSACQR